MNINQSIFKAYDIRGIYPDELNESTAYQIGRALVQFLKCKNVVVGRDMRKSGESLFKELTRGINEEGADVIDIGLCTTPMFYFCVANYNYDAGIMITASHNPSAYNGFKITREQAIPISGDTGIKEIYQLANQSMAEGIGGGKIVKKEFIEDYVKNIINGAKIDKKFKVVIDCANGMGYLEIDNILNKLNLEIIEMYKSPDDRFPNHEANPLKKENLKDLQEKVKAEKADLGIAFDGDVDRVGFVDENGEIISGDMITVLISESILKQEPNSTILYDLRSSRAVKEIIEENDGEAIQCRVGHAFIKQQMRDTDAVFAGELSSHFYFKKHFYTESPMLAIIEILSLLSSTGKKISELVKPIKKYFSSGEINFEVKDKEKTIKLLAEKHSDGKIYWLDGISVDYADWWFNVRPSNTEPVLRLNMEANSQDLLDKKFQEISGVIGGD